ncbi:MAG: hypothetical protein M3Y48_13465 [Actinomycetota bacterium]|nr:hypothetical protein [Actinomycetota bacterium]
MNNDHGRNDSTPTMRMQRVVPATCTMHGDTPGFTNIRVSRRDGTIVLDPHATGSCVTELDEDGARALRDVLTEWLG